MIRIRREVQLSILVAAVVGFAALGPLTGLAAPGSAAPGESVTVYLHAAARLEGGEYTLGEVASLISSDPSRAESLSRLPLGSIPERPTLLPAAAIQSRIAPVADRAVVVGGRIALIPGKTIPKHQEWFYTALLAFVDSRDAWNIGRIEIELLNSPLFLEGLPELRSGEGEMAAGWEDRIIFDAPESPYNSGYRSSLSGTALPAGTLQVSYRILAAGPVVSGTDEDGWNPAGLPAGSQRSLEGSFRIWIHHFLPVARAAVDLPAGRNLTEDALSFSAEDVSLLRSSFVVQGEAVEEYRTIASLRRGERVDGQRLQRVPAVRAGDRVMITFARPGLTVRVPGRALRSGSVGDAIDVRPESSTVRIQARIAGKGEVFIESD